MAEHYQRPGWFTRHVFNPLVALLTRLGISVAGSRVLEVRGRKTGEWRPTPVNLLRFEDCRYLVVPLCQMQWVKNVRVNPVFFFNDTPTTETFTAVELPD